jgi:hypothetical protein
VLLGLPTFSTARASAEKAPPSSPTSFFAGLQKTPSFSPAFSPAYSLPAFSSQRMGLIEAPPLPQLEPSKLTNVSSPDTPVPDESQPDSPASQPLSAAACALQPALSRQTTTATELPSSPGSPEPAGARHTAARLAIAALVAASSPPWPREPTSSSNPHLYFTPDSNASHTNPGAGDSRPREPASSPNPHPNLTTYLRPREPASSPNPHPNSTPNLAGTSSGEASPWQPPPAQPLLAGTSSGEASPWQPPPAQPLPAQPPPAPPPPEQPPPKQPPPTEPPPPAQPSPAQPPPARPPPAQPPPAQPLPANYRRSCHRRSGHMSSRHHRRRGRRSECKPLSVPHAARLHSRARRRQRRPSLRH